MEFGQSACMFHISYGLQWRQGLRYIADSNTGDRGVGNDDIIIFFKVPDISNFVGEILTLVEISRSKKSNGLYLVFQQIIKIIIYRVEVYHMKHQSY
jgi:hypothetical protein